MAVTSIDLKDVRSLIKNMRGLLRVPAKRYSVDYDEEADVLYISFRKPQHATDSELLDDGIIVSTAGKDIVGLTILDASKR